MVLKEQFEIPGGLKKWSYATEKKLFDKEEATVTA